MYSTKVIAPIKATVSPENCAIRRPARPHSCNQNNKEAPDKMKAHAVFAFIVDRFGNTPFRKRISNIQPNKAQTPHDK